jgi:competence protein CoiA
MENVMRFALVNNEKIEAQRGLKGQCPGCSQPVKARCGDQRRHHWAHLPKNPCPDRWWEPETQWHRDWKNNFPFDWQEYRHQDQSSGEWHIADVQTIHGLVVEFQNSHLDSQERIARESFYKNMVWVVNGMRLKRVYSRFVKARADFRETGKQGFFLVYFPDEAFPANWLESAVPVLFDFHGTQNGESSEIIEEPLWCLLPGRAEGYAIVVKIPRQQFIEVISNRSFLMPAREIVENTAQNIRQARQIQEMQALNYMRQQQFIRRPRRRYRRF